MQCMLFAKGISEDISTMPFGWSSRYIDLHVYQLVYVFISAVHLSEQDNLQMGAAFFSVK